MLLNPFAIDRLTPMPWKNGGGTTREVVAWPIGAGLDDFDWRISIASIAASGPFSAFAGIDRTILLLDGDGVHLASPDHGIDHRLDQRWQPFAFAGEAPIDCTLLGGPSTDFNLMTRRDRVQGLVEVLTPAQRGTGQPNPVAFRSLLSEGLVLAVRGRWQIETSAVSHSPHPVTFPALPLRRFDAGRGFWWATGRRELDDAATPIVSLQPESADACLIRVTIIRHWSANPQRPSSNHGTHQISA